MPVQQFQPMWLWSVHVFSKDDTRVIASGNIVASSVGKAMAKAMELYKITTEKYTVSCRCEVTAICCEAE